MTLRRFITLASIAAALPWPAFSEPVEVHWDAQGRFEHELPVAAGKFAEVCEKLPAGAKVQWRFEASAPLDFNIHYHEGKDVRFPAKQDQQTRGEGEFEAQLAQHYCWMWGNPGGVPASVSVTLSRGA